MNVQSSQYRSTVYSTILLYSTYTQHRLRNVFTMASKTTNGTSNDAKSFYENEHNLAKLCDFLRSEQGPPVREAVEMDKRVHYLKGKFCARRWPRRMCPYKRTHDTLLRIIVTFGNFIWPT